MNKTKIIKTASVKDLMYENNDLKVNIESFAEVMRRARADIERNLYADIGINDAWNNFVDDRVYAEAN